MTGVVFKILQKMGSKTHSQKGGVYQQSALGNRSRELRNLKARNLNAARERVIKKNVHLAERLPRRRNKKWKKFENKVGTTHEKLERNSDRFKFVNISDRLRRKRGMLINETKSGV